MDRLVVHFMAASLCRTYLQHTCAPRQVSELSDSKAENFRHMELSCKGSERQRPSILQQTLRFQQILGDTSRAVTESNILGLVDEWNTQPFVIANKKWQISKVARIAITNLTVSVDDSTLEVMMAHLHWWKWTESCAPLAQTCGRHSFCAVVLVAATWMQARPPQSACQPWGGRSSQLPHL